VRTISATDDGLVALPGGERAELAIDRASSLVLPTAILLTFAALDRCKVERLFPTSSKLSPAELRDETLSVLECLWYPSLCLFISSSLSTRNLSVPLSSPACMHMAKSESSSIVSSTTLGRPISVLHNLIPLTSSS